MWRAAGILVAIVLVLLALGAVMLASTGSVKGGEIHGDSLYYLKKQAVWMLLAVGAAALSAFAIDYHWWRTLAVPVFILAVIGLALVFIPGVGCMVGGARRWIRIGNVQIGQPSEFAKFASIVILAAWFTLKGRRAGSLFEGIVLPLGILGILLALIMLEPDYGTTFLIGLTGMAIMFVAGARPVYLGGAGVLGVAGFLVAIMHNEVRFRRFMAFLSPDQYPREAYQLKQSIDAFILGGGWGAGLGESVQKHNYLPEAQTDFIMAIIGEELGLSASLMVALLFVVFFICGLVISIKTSDIFGRLLSFGITTIISLQAAINVGVVTGCLPTKGLPLPFISAGGSSLVMTMFCVGVLLNVARHGAGHIDDVHTKPIKDNLHWI